MNFRSKITVKELQVLALIAKEFSSDEIALKLDITSKTVENHRYNIARKLNLSGNNCVLIYALANKEKLTKSSTQQK